MDEQEPLDQRILLAEERTELATERTQLAAERTLSAWMRTGLAGVGGGLGIIHLLHFKSTFHKMAADVLGELFILWGIIIFVFAFVDYRLFCKRLEIMTGYRQSQLAIGSLVFFLVVSSFFFLMITIHRLHFLYNET